MFKGFLPIVVLSLMTSQPALAFEYKFNGFVSLVGARIISGSGGSDEFPMGRECPCFVADYNSGALYEDGKTVFDHESRAGLQLNLSFSDQLSLITQVVARSYSEDINLEWVYLSWDLTSDWTVQVGRKRIPIYYYSEFQDVGIAYMWARPPQTLYGWEASNYNGASVRYTSSFGDWSLRASVYGGNEEVKDAGYNTIYFDEDQDSRWKNILGGDIEVSRDWFTGRLIVMTSENSNTNRPDDPAYYSPPMEQTIIGLALNADFGDWFLLSEINLNQRDFVGDDFLVKAPAYQFGVGYRFGKWTPFFSWSRYWESVNTDPDTYAPERFIDTSFTLRYDLNSSMALKFQYDDLSDESKSDFVGDTQLITIAFDMVF